MSQHIPLSLLRHTPHSIPSDIPQQSSLCNTQRDTDNLVLYGHVWWVQVARTNVITRYMHMNQLYVIIILIVQGMLFKVCTVWRTICECMQKRLAGGKFTQTLAAPLYLEEYEYFCVLHHNHIHSSISVQLINSCRSSYTMTLCECM